MAKKSIATRFLVIAAGAAVFAFAGLALVMPKNAHAQTAACPSNDSPAVIFVNGNQSVSVGTAAAFAVRVLNNAQGGGGHPFTMQFDCPAGATCGQQTVTDSMPANSSLYYYTVTPGASTPSGPINANLSLDSFPGCTAAGSGYLAVTASNPVDGRCGPASSFATPPSDASQLCAVGSVQNMTANASGGWTWNCVASGNPASCSATNPGGGSGASSADFSLTATPSYLTIERGQSATVNVSMNPRNGFSLGATLSTSANAALSASFSPVSVSPGQPSTMTIAIASSSAPGVIPVTLRATASPTSSATTDISVNVTPGVCTKLSYNRTNSNIPVTHVNSGDSFVVNVDYGQANIDAIQAPSVRGYYKCSFKSWSGTTAQYTCIAPGVGFTTTFDYQTGLTDYPSGSHVCAGGPDYIGTVTVDSSRTSSNVIEVTPAAVNFPAAGQAPIASNACVPPAQFVTIRNVGYGTGRMAWSSNVNGSSARSWCGLYPSDSSDPNYGSLAVGDSYSVAVRVNPPSTMGEGVHGDCVINIFDSNDPLYVHQSIPVTYTISPSDPAQQCGGPVGNPTSSTPGVPTADLSIANAVSNPAPHEGDAINYTITVNAGGPSSSLAVAVQNAFPAGLKFNSAAVSGGSFVTSTGLWTIGTMTAGSNATLRVFATVSSGTAGTVITDTATASQSATLTDPNPANNSATATFTVASATAPVSPTADISVTNVASNPTPHEGDIVTYTVTVSAAGPSSSLLVAAQNILPTALNFVSANTSGGAYSSSTGAWTIGTMTPGSAQTLSLAGSVKTGQAGKTISSVATVAESGSLIDPNPANNSAVATIIVATSTGGGGGGGGGTLGCTLRASPASITTGASSTLTWSCTASGSVSSTPVTCQLFAPGPILIGSGGKTGAATVRPATSSSYSLSCNAGAVVATSNIQVKILNGKLIETAP